MVLHSRGKVRVLKLRLKDSDTKHFECYLIFWNFTRKGRCTMFPLINKRETGVNLRRIMDMRGITPKDVQEYLGLGCVQSVYRWLDGINLPTIDNMYALSELLQVPIDAIVRGNRAPIVPDIIAKPLDARERRLRAYYEKLNEKYVA